MNSLLGPFVGTVWRAARFENMISDNLKLKAYTGGAAGQQGDREADHQSRKVLLSSVDL